MRFGSRERPEQAPAEVVARADLPPGEKVLASAESAGVWLVGTRAAFVVVAASRILCQKVASEREGMGPASIPSSIQRG